VRLAQSSVTVSTFADNTSCMVVFLRQSTATASACMLHHLQVAYPIKLPTMLSVPLLATISLCLPAILCQAAAAAAIGGDGTRFSLLNDGGSQHILADNVEANEPAYVPTFLQRDDGRSSGFIAIGDSYSAGIGTGVEGKEGECRQGLHAYPILINTDISNDQGPNVTSFQWLSCTGATTANLLSGGPDSQIDALNVSTPHKGAGGPDFALLSIGGNDLGFFDVINACIFRFYSFYSGTCEAALEKADALIASPDFELQLQLVLLELLDKVTWERRPWFVVTVTGYARFFNADTDACDDMSLGVWWGGPKLKKDVREKMNKLVAAVNEKLRRGIADLNAKFSKPKAFFVDYDAEFEGHRFCEPDVKEPDYNRTDTWFFLVGGPDHNTTLPNATAAELKSVLDYPTQLLPALSPLVDTSTCLERAQRRGDWGELALCYMAMAKERDPSLRFAYDDITTQNSMWYVPTYYGKVFHPRSFGHEVMRDKVYQIWREHEL
jgi:hypothetical protein